MEELNPYAPPNPEKLTSEPAGDLPVDEIHARVVVDIAYVKSYHQRFTSLSQRLESRRWARYLLGATFVALDVYCLVLGNLEGAAFITTILVIGVLLTLAKSWLVRRRVSKLMRLNDTWIFRISRSGIHVTTNQSNHFFHWSNYSKAVIYEDGVVFMDQKVGGIWLPDSSMVRDEIRLALRQLAADVLTTEKASARASWWKST